MRDVENSACKSIKLELFQCCNYESTGNVTEEVWFCSDLESHKECPRLLCKKVCRTRSLGFSGNRFVWALIRTRKPQDYVMCAHERESVKDSGSTRSCDLEKWKPSQVSMSRKRHFIRCFLPSK